MGRVYQEGAWPVTTNKLIMFEAKKWHEVLQIYDCSLQKISFSSSKTVQDAPNVLSVWVNLVPFNPMYFRLRMTYETPG